MAQFNVSLPESLKSFIEAEVAAGRFRSPAEYLSSLVREAKKRKSRERVEALLQEALDSNERIEATPAFWKQLQAEVERTVTKAKKR